MSNPQELKADQNISEAGFKPAEGKTIEKTSSTKVII